MVLIRVTAYHQIDNVCAKMRADMLNQLTAVSALLGSENYPVISTHSDELKERRQDYGQNQKPADYLESFNEFIHKQLNQSAALGVVVNRPKDLTREQLREVRLLLDQHGFSEASLKSAWRNQTNQEIAASIIGYIRQAAIGEALMPFDQRVAKAMQTIYTGEQTVRNEPRAPRFAPAGQSTQLIVGADDTDDSTILHGAEALYGNFKLRRVYYSAFSPIPNSPKSVPLAAPPLMREHRLYQADFLLRSYGFSAN